MDENDFEMRMELNKKLEKVRQYWSDISEFTTIETELRSVLMAGLKNCESS